MDDALRFFVVEDEMLLLMQLETFLEEAGHAVVASALSSREAVEAVEAASTSQADIALVDVHLADGPTGIEVGRFIAERTEMAVVFMTANPKQLPADFSGALGVIAKPYTKEGLFSALRYLVRAVRAPPPCMLVPRSLALAPTYARRWPMDERPAGN